MKKLFYLFTALLLLNSCGVKYKTIPYFVDLPVDTTISEVIQNQSILKIQKSDILAITVSSLNEKSDSYFNAGNMGTIQSPNSSSTSSIPNGFIVDQLGNVQLPYLGTVKLEGLTTNEARLLVQSKLVTGNFLSQPIVNLRLVNFKISVLGDVAKPGVYPVSSERITLVEAISMAGDLSITAKRNNVLLIRENQEKRQQIRLDLQSKDLFNSPYYYLQNNDVIYVQPSEAKYASIDASYRNIGLVVSVLSVLALFISRF